ncbi:cardiolipin synthase [Paradevosia shaoguanensis]|uniref:cardiolipin synthase n=1 Tax=Paradevosia shaoguanensis TaxID=1335043 RepID=UPI003C73B4C4
MSGAPLAVFFEHLDIVAWFLAANFLLAAACAIREVMNSRTSQGSIAWLLSLIMLPFPTAFLYLIFGWKLFDDYDTVQTHSGRRARAEQAAALKLTDPETTSQWPVLANVAQMPFLRGNDAELLIDGEATFASIFAGIRRAQDYILIQFYIIRDDRLGQQLAELLIERARAGVTVRILYDDVGSNGLPLAYLQRLRDAGVQVASFNQRHPFLRIYGPTRINYRSHRKVVSVDGKEAWVGGHNVGVEYLGEDPRFGHWRDTQVHVTGPAALAVSLVFREDWEWATGERLVATMPDDVEMPGDQPVLVMPTGPADKLEGCAIAFTEVIARARKRLWIVSPYFVPGLDVQTALYAAALRGVEVRLLLPKKPDHILVWLASNSHADQMIGHGISVYRYLAGFLHEKIILVDDTIAGVGTVNFDNRSFTINFECTLWFTHPDMIAAVDRMLDADFAASHETRLEDVRAQPWLQRFIGQAARLFSPIL